MDFLIRTASLLLIISLCSCEGYTERTFLVNNKSSSPLTVESADLNEDTTLTVVSPGEELMVSSWGSLGGQRDAGEPSDYLNHFVVFNETDTSTVEYEVKNSWSICTSHDSKIPSAYTHIFVLKVSDNDF